MSFVGQTVTIGFYDSSTHGNTLATIAPEFLIDSESFVVTSEPDGIFNWLAADAFGDVGRAISFTYGNAGSESYPTADEHFSIYATDESGTQFISPLLLAVSITSGFSAYSPAMEWNNGAATPALPDMFSLGEHLALDVGNYLLPQPASGKRVRIRFAPASFWTAFVRSSES